MTTVWIYVDTSKEAGDRDHLKVLATEDAAEKWFEDNDPIGVAFEYEVEGYPWEHWHRGLRYRCRPGSLDRLLCSPGLRAGAEAHPFPSARSYVASSFFTYEVEMTDQEIVLRAFTELRKIAAKYIIETDPRDAQITTNQMLSILERREVVAAAERLSKGYGLRVVK